MPSSTVEFYNRISHLYDAIADGGEHKAREHGLKLLSVMDGEQVLEIGFGTGHSLVAMAKSVGDSGCVYGIDVASGMRDVTANRVAQEGLQSRIDLRVAEVPPLPYDDGMFNVVSLSFTLELFPLETIPVLLLEIKRVLVRDGRLGVVSMATVRGGEKESVLERSYKWMHAHFPHIVDCQPIDVERHLREAGFKLIKDDRIEIFTMPVAAVVGILQ